MSEFVAGSRWDVVELRTQGGVLVLGRSTVGGLGGIERTYGRHGGSLRGRDVSWIAAHLRDNYELFRLRSECGRLGIHGLSDHVSNAQMLAVLARAIDDGQVVALFLPTRLHPLWRLAAEDVLASPDAARPPAGLGAGAVSSWSAAQKIEAALKRVPGHLAGELKTAFLSLLSPASIGVMVAAFVGLAVAQAYGVGELIDAGLAAYAYYLAGMAGLAALYDLVATTMLVSRAQSEADLEADAARYAHDFTVLGVSIVSLLILHASRRSRSLGEDSAPPPPPERPPPSEPPPPRSGGRLGSAKTRAQNAAIADDLESKGYAITNGGGVRGEEYIRGSGPGTTGSTFVDITARNPDTGEVLRVQTIDTLADGSPTAREAAAAARIQAAYPNDTLLLIPKEK